MMLTMPGQSTRPSLFTRRIVSVVLFVIAFPALPLLWMGGSAFRSRVAFYVLTLCTATPLLDHFYRVCAEAVTEDGGDILEIGFGSGRSAHYMPRRGVSSHTIIEIDDYIFEQLLQWARDKPTVVPPLHPAHQGRLVQRHPAQHEVRRDPLRPLVREHQ